MPDTDAPTQGRESAASTPQQLNLDLFADKSRWPKKPYCSEDKSARCIRSLASAMTRPYIQANPPHLRVWSIFDVDRRGGAIAWEDASLPPPSWAAANRENGHAHLVWGLSVPVLVNSPNMRQRPLRYLCAVEAAFRERLQADHGYSGLITKNPAHPLWAVLRGPRLAYDLGYLSEWVDLPQHLPKRKPEEVGLGRNVTVFEWLRQHAYCHIRYYKREVRNFVLWHSYLNGKALGRNGDFQHPMDGREVWHIAKSVAKWTWNRFDLEASDARFSALQAHRGRSGGVASGHSRAAASEDKRASAHLMRAQGKTQQAIAAELGVTERTVRNWLNQTGNEAIFR
jgi:Primase C terminal 1 (PriCT-1)./Replicase family.